MIEDGNHFVWVTKGVLTDDELDQLRENDVDVTDFNYELLPTDRDGIDGALHTIAEHHSGQTILCEHKIEL
jgi:hypothetical protein